MTFDSDISKEVSLSKVLDAFIIENERPEVIVAFLKHHEDAFQDILQYSLYCNKLFQLDFFLTCSYDEQEYIINKLKEINVNDAAILVWQILKSNSEKIQRIKLKIKQNLHTTLDNSIRHPYRYGHQRYIGAFDDICFKMAEANRFTEIPYLVKAEAIRNICNYVSYSLFQDRLMQYDLVSELDDATKYVFINSVFDNCKTSSIIRLALQILDSNDEIEVKKLVVKKLYSNITPTDLLDNNILDIVLKCESFSELMLKMAIFNSDVSIFVVLYLLLFKTKWIKEWVEFDENELNSYLNISELVKYYIKEGYSKK